MYVCMCVRMHACMVTVYGETHVPVVSAEVRGLGLGLHVQQRQPRGGFHIVAWEGNREGKHVYMYVYTCMYELLWNFSSQVVIMYVCMYVCLYV